MCIPQQLEHIRDAQLTITSTRQPTKLEEMMRKFIKFLRKEIRANEPRNSTVVNLSTNFRKLTNMSTWSILDVHKKANLVRTISLRFILCPRSGRTLRRLADWLNT